MNRPRIAAAALTLTITVVFAGCGGQAWLYQHPRGWGQLVTGCPPMVTAEVCQRLPAVQMTTEASAREAWQYEARVKVIAPVPGVPGATMSYGRAPIDVTIVGPREDFERVRQFEAAEGNPTEPCKGPLYFRRDQ